MPFTEDLDQFFDADEFATEVVIDPGGPSESTISGIFDAEAEVIDVESEGLTGTVDAPRVTCRSSDLAGVVQGTTVQVDGETYSVHDPRPDGTGVTVLWLHRT